jgi:diguanylate cyclase (GGDEF)-like protein
MSAPPSIRYAPKFSMRGRASPLARGVQRASLRFAHSVRVISRQTVVGGLLWFVLPGFILVQVLASLWIHNHQFDAMERQLADQVAKLAASRSAILAEPLWRMQYGKVQSVLDEIISADGVTHAAVFDDTGALVAGFGSEHANDTRDYLSVTQPITYRDGNHATTAGRLVIRFSNAGITSQLQQGLRNALVVSLLATVATLVGLWWATQYVVGRPLAAISDAIRRTRAGGEWVKAVVTSRNEIGLLALAFNEMQDRQREAQENLERVAAHDALTGLVNRHRFEAMFEATIRAGGDRRIALHFVDMDGFKKINDTFGHEAGDQFLKQVAARLIATAGPSDVVARIGGDEFLVLQPDVTGTDEAAALAQRIIDAVADPVSFEDIAIVPCCCIGFAVRHVSDPEVRSLRALADVALYDAKASGPGQVATLTDDRLNVFKRVRSLETALPDALADQQFEQWFQAQIDLRTNRTIAVEALSRWHHPQHGMVSPIEFLPLIERNRLGQRLMTVVLDGACDMIRRLHEVGHTGVRVAVNVSAQELSDEALVKRVRAIAHRHEVPLSALEVEITEGAIIHNFAVTSQIVGQLRDQGVTVALDDFGTGYSSLAYLRRLPIDKLKIDKSFVRDAAHNAEARAVLETISHLARRLNLQVVAEGIEDPQHALLTRLLGADIGQGYLFHHPQPASLCIDFLGANLGRPPTADPVSNLTSPWSWAADIHTDQGADRVVIRDARAS